MSNININLQITGSFGTSGTGEGQFQYPSGSVVANNALYIVDKQNNRVQYFELDGTFIGEFDGFSFPEGITADDDYLYIADSGNHKIKIHEFDGTFISEFGSYGTGEMQFDYPTGIFHYDGMLLIADKQNSRIKIHEINGDYVLDFNDSGAMSFPEAAIVVDSSIVVCDSGNKLLKFFALNGVKSFDAAIDFEYPVGISETDGILTISDRQANALVYIDLYGNYIETSEEALNFNTSVVYYDGSLFVVNSGDHDVLIYDMIVELNVPTFSSRLLKLTKQLYPTGRAWLMHFGGVFEQFHEALSYSESRVHSASRSLLDSILPDNDNFTTTDATRWELALGLLNQTTLTLEERKLIILRKMQYPGDIKARQSAAYMQDELQKVGFDVYVYPNNKANFLNPVGAIFGQVKHGQVKHGQVAGNYTIVANKIEDEPSFYVGDKDALRACFFVGGATLSSRADVDPDRKDEFRELILKLKPAHSVGLLNIDYTL